MEPSIVPEPQREVEIPIAAEGGLLRGILALPAEASGLVLFSQGSGSSRFNPRDRSVAGALRAAGLATLLLDLLTDREEAIDRYTAYHRFDIARLARRLIAATDWMEREPGVRDLPFGYLGAGTGTAAALVAAAERPQRIRAVVSRSGRPDLAGEALSRVVAPTLLIVGGEDDAVLDLNRRAVAAMSCLAELAVIPHATDLFEDPDALERVADLAAGWLRGHLDAPPEVLIAPPHPPAQAPWGRLSPRRHTDGGSPATPSGGRPHPSPGGDRPRAA